MKISGAQALVQTLDQEGVRAVFGIPGAYSMPIFDALYRHPRIECFSVRHEQGATFMADGYARASGQIAAALLLPGPGVTNGYTGLGEAYMDSSPVLLLATQIKRPFINQDRGLLHELNNQLEVLAPVMKFSERVTEAASMAETTRRAMRAIRHGRPRPVQIEIPLDTQLEMTDWSEADEGWRPAPAARALPPAAALEAAARVLQAAERPLIFAGGGVISAEASAVVVQLAELLGAPVLTTGMGVGCIPGDHPLAAGVPWLASVDARPLFAACDAFLAIGTRFNEAMTYGWNLPLPANTIRIDVDAQEIERNLPMKHKLVGDALATGQALLQWLRQAGLNRRGQAHPRLAQAQRDVLQAHARRVGSSTPWMQALRASLPRDAILSADMSVFWADMLGSFPFYQPRSALFPWGYGTLGFGLPEALGAKIACPQRPVAAIVGDGAFLFTGAELATAVQYKLNVPILVPNNNAYGMIKKQQGEQFDERYMAVELHNPDFVQLAHAFGAGGERVSTPEELGAAITRALAAAGPTVIEFPWGYKFAT